MKNLYIFDCFGVVVTDVSTLWMNTRLTQQQQLYARAELFRNVDCGKMSFDDSIVELGKMCNMPAQAVRAEWDSFIHPMVDTLQILAELRNAGHTVALLSNASASNLNEIFTQFDVHKYFDKLFISSNYGCAKPDRQLYQICLNSFTERFGKIYFTDDNPANLQGLQELGITPILFTNATQLKRQLELDEI